MSVRVLLTVDTELTWRHFARGAGWRENLARSYDPAGVGVPYQLEQLARHGLKACFFVDPMPALLYGIEPIQRMVEPILRAGQEVQLHLHSFWFDAARCPQDTPRFELTAFEPDAQRELIGIARDLLEKAGAPSPIAFRSGSYAADGATLQALRSLGIRYDSSHNGADHPWPSALPFRPDMVDLYDHDGVTESPVSVIRGRGGRLRPLQLCALSSAEMQAALRHASENDFAVATIVNHSFELATRDGLRVNETIRGRFDRLCAFLAEHGAQMPTATFADLAPLERSAGSMPMEARPVQTARRMLEQLWSNARYERSVMAAAIFGMTSPSTFEYLIGHASV